MKVVLLRSNPVNPDSRVEKEVNSLLKHGFKVEIVAWDRDNKYKIKESFLNLQEGKVKIHRLGIPSVYGGGIKKNLIPLMKFQIGLYLWLSKNKDKFDVIHACDFDTSYIGFKICKKFNKKLVYDIFDYYVDAFSVPKHLKYYIEKLDHKIINFADATIICSEKRRKQIERTNPKKLVIIHNTPSKLEENIKKLSLNVKKIKLVYVGILTEGRYIKEIADIIKNNKKYEFHVGGFGNLDSYFKEMSNEFDNIVFYGKLPYKETLELENSCDIMTAIYDPEITNHYYAAPNKFYEALMLGKPIIMVQNTGMDHIVKNYKLGEVIEYNKESLKDALSRLTSRKEEWGKISLRAKKLYENKYSWNIMEERLIEMYKSL